MKKIFFLMLFSAVALGQIKEPAGVSPSNSATFLKFAAQAGSGASAFEMTQGAKFCLDGSTCAKNLTSDGTTLTLTGLKLGATAFKIPSGGTGFGLFGNEGNVMGLSNSGSDIYLTVPTGFTQRFLNSAGTQFVTIDATGLKIGNAGTPILSSIRGTGTLDFASAGAGACSAVLTITVTGAVAGTEVSLGVPNASNTTGSVFFPWVSATDTVSVKHCCISGTCDPASGSFAARVFNP